ncbi:MAG: hypothetical protein AABY87_11750 [bacterium]
MVNQIIKKQLKHPKFKIPLFIALFLFVFQTNPVFCACLPGGDHAAGSCGAMSEKSPCQGDMPMKACHDKASDTKDGSSNSGADTCPLCQCLMTGNIESQKVMAAMSLDPVPGNLACDISHMPGDTLNAAKLTRLGLPQAPVRTHPLFVINRTFRI